MWRDERGVLAAQFKCEHSAPRWVFFLPGSGERFRADSDFAAPERIDAVVAGALVVDQEREVCATELMSSVSRSCASTRKVE